jgi:hypothetical protein
MIEKLEQRMLLTAELNSNGVVEVRGTDEGDTIRIRTAGDQLVVSENGNDTSFTLTDVQGISVRADDGNDLVQLDPDVMAAELEGDDGSDTLIGGDGNDTLRGGAGNDHLDGKLGGDIIDGGGGFDSADYRFRDENLTLSINNQADDGAGGAAEGDNIQVDVERIVGGNGDDDITGSDADNSISAWRGNDTVSGGDGNDSIDGDEGNDLLIGQVGDDRLTGGSGADRMEGSGGDDTFLSEDGERDEVMGGPGNDRAENADSGVDQFDDVEDAPRPPVGEISVFRALVELEDGESSVNFGSAEQGQAGPSIAFTIRNDGKGTLNIGSITVPDGFTLVEDFGGSLAPGESGSFTIRLNTNQLGDQSGQVRINSNDTNEDPFNFGISGRVVEPAPVRAPEITVLRSGNVIVDGKGSISFGNVLRGTVEERTFVVRNDGDERLNLGSLNVPVGFIVMDGLVSSLKPGDSDQVTIRMVSVAAGVFGGQVSFGTNDSDENPFNFSINGTVENKTPVQRPEIVVTLSGQGELNSDGGRISFGKAKQNANGATRTFTVTNTGNATLTLGSVALPKGYTLVDGLSSSLGAGASDSFAVRMVTSTLGSRNGQIRFSNNDSNENPFVINVSGSVVRAPTPRAGKMVLMRGGKKVNNGATLNFGKVLAGRAAKAITLTIRNAGNAKLSVGTVRAPSGFALAKAPPKSLAAGKSGSLTIRMPSSSAGTKSGSIKIGSMTLNLIGTVTQQSGGGGGGGGGANINASVDRDGTLHVIGGGGADTITVRGAANAVTVTINGGSKTFSSVKRIAVRGNDGNDNINLTGTSVRAALDGGIGNDTIRGGGGSDTIHGGVGNDSLIGGFGADLIFGDDNDDILDSVDGTADIRVDGGPGNDQIRADPTDSKTGT